MLEAPELWLAVDLILVAGASAWVLATSEQRSSGQTLSWLLAFLLLPVAGVLLYITLGYRGFRLRKRLRSSAERLRDRGRIQPGVPTDKDLNSVFALAENLTGIPARGIRSFQLHDDAYSAYGSLAEAIRSATTSIDLEYYIFQPDETGLSFRQLLIERARAGVQCRLLYDAVGSYRLRSQFLGPLQDAGVQVEAFAPVRLSRLWSFHYRNHRKIAVIDGRVGFLGSQNIGNEYLGWKNRNRSCRDILIRFEGSAVQELSSIFEDDWELASAAGPSVGKKTARSALPTSESNDISLSILPTGPDEKRHSLEMILCTLLTQAKKEVRVVTPYFIPSLPLRLALAATAHRGVGVKILLPKSSDQLLVDLAGRSVIPSLANSGVEFFEYDQSFLHAKLILVDQELALVGSANMDERSFRLNWECSALISGRDAILAADSSVSALLSASRPIREVSKPGFLRRILHGILHLTFPLL